MSAPAPHPPAPPADRAARRAELEAYQREHVVTCTRCRLAEGRTQVVVGNGDPDADLMFVGEAPGYHEDRQGIPFVGQAGQLLDRLLGEIGLGREQVFVANVLKCRPPGNRDPQADEIASCRPHLLRQVALVRPRMICSLGNFATKLLSGRPEGISRVHGHELPITVGEREVLLYPLFHPAAVLRTRRLEEVMRADIARIPGLLAAAAGTVPPPVPVAAPAPPAGAAGGPPEREHAPPAPTAPDPAALQLGLF